jgi:hypothetical protein
MPYGSIEKGDYEEQRQKEVYGHLGVMGYGLWVMGYGLWVMGYGLWVMG